MLILDLVTSNNRHNMSTTEVTEEIVAQAVQEGRLGVVRNRHSTQYAGAKWVLDTGWIHVMGQFQETETNKTGPDPSYFTAPTGGAGTTETHPETRLYTIPFLYWFDTDSEDTTVTLECSVKVIQKYLFSDPVSQLASTSAAYSTITLDNA